jgi:hypothetical protein
MLNLCQQQPEFRLEEYGLCVTMREAQRWNSACLIARSCSSSYLWSEVAGKLRLEEHRALEAKGQRGKPQEVSPIYQ